MNNKKQNSMSVGTIFLIIIGIFVTIFQLSFIYLFSKNDEQKQSEILEEKQDKKEQPDDNSDIDYGKYDDIYASKKNNNTVKNKRLDLMLKEGERYKFRGYDILVNKISTEPEESIYLSITNCNYSCEPKQIRLTRDDKEIFIDDIVIEFGYYHYPTKKAYIIILYDE